MKKIPLTRGKSALVDDADYARASMFNWHAMKGHSTWYARRNSNRRDGVRGCVLLHRFILKTSRQVDHIDRDGLNCQRQNLRAASHAQNNMNQRKRRGTSRFKGVYLAAGDTRWCARIGMRGKLIYLGRFENEEDAARAYDLAAERLFGRFARTNHDLGLIA